MQRFSYLNSIWLEEEHAKEVVNKIVEEHGVSYAVARLLYLVPNLKYEAIADFLSPKIKNLMPNPNHLLDIPKAVERLHSAILNGEKITIFGDYDVDGATSSAIISNYLKSIGVASEIYIPDRVLEGYGPNVEAMLKIARGGTKLLITVDCGTVAFEPLEVAHNVGMDAIVIDHHIGVKNIPKSIAVVNPNRLDETTHLKYLCGAGVSFLMIVALNTHLREQGFFSQRKIPEPKILELTPLVALGTVCDVMKLEGLNRAFVTTGLQVLEKWENVGLRALKDVACVTELDEQTFGFTFGPCINAGGRIGDASLGAKLLTCEKYEDALPIAKKLHALNVERREIEKQMREDALAQLEQKDFSREGLIFHGSESYHQGVIGILASRLKDKYNKPAFIYSQLDGVIKASGRSIAGVDIGLAVNKAVKQGLLVAGGGHEMAAGFTCALEKVSEFHAFLQNEIGKKALKLGRFKISQYAFEIPLCEVSLPLYNEIQKLKPFGQGNSKPVFIIRNVELSFWQRRGGKHVFMVLIDSSGVAVKGIFFNFFEHLPDKTIYELELKQFDVLCEITVNNWNGSESVELNIKDIRDGVNV
jgi:single-stranded-DNA-specific exonuclease